MARETVPKGLRAQALRAFQTAEGLPATGRTDAATLDALGVGGGG